MIGTFANVAAIIIGSLIGGLVKKILKEEYTKCLYVAMGLAACGLGINAIVQNMPDSNYPVLFIASLAAGGLIGTICKIDGRVGRLSSGKAAKKQAEACSGECVQAEGSSNIPGVADDLRPEKKTRLGEGVVTGSLLFCVGTLSILGPVQSALYQDYTYLFTNSMLDLVTSMVLAATYGVGMVIAAGILFVWQGSIYMLTVLLGDFITSTMMTELSIVGGFLILSSGLAILEIKDCKTLNMLPALAIPIIWCLVVG